MRRYAYRLQLYKSQVVLRVMETMKHRVNHAQDDITDVIAELTTI